MHAGDPAARSDAQRRNLEGSMSSSFLTHSPASPQPEETVGPPVADPPAPMPEAPPAEEPAPAAVNKRSQIRIRVGSENRPCSGRGLNSSLGEEGWSTLV